MRLKQYGRYAMAGVARRPPPNFAPSPHLRLLQAKLWEMFANRLFVCPGLDFDQVMDVPAGVPVCSLWDPELTVFKSGGRQWSARTVFSVAAAIDVDPVAEQEKHELWHSVGVQYVPLTNEQVDAGALDLPAFKVQVKSAVFSPTLVPWRKLVIPQQREVA